MAGKDIHQNGETGTDRRTGREYTEIVAIAPDQGTAQLGGFKRCFSSALK